MIIHQSCVLFYVKIQIFVNLFFVQYFLRFFLFFMILVDQGESEFLVQKFPASLILHKL